MKIYGHLIVSNEQTSDICRALESIYPICDSILVLHDGTQLATIDWLENRKEIYNLKIWENPFTTVREQRNFLLQKTPIDNWICALDADEKYSQATSRELRDCLLYKLSDKHEKTAREANMPLVINIPHINLVQDIMHWDSDAIFHSQKIFFFSEGLHFDFDEYFTHLSCKPGPLTFEKDGTEVYSIIGPKEWALLHYARLSIERLRWRAKHVNDPKFGNYALGAWEKLPPKIILLDKSRW